MEMRKVSLKDITPPSTGVRYIPQAHVHAIMPDGTHITLLVPEQVAPMQHVKCGAGYYSAQIDVLALRCHN